MFDRAPPIPAARALPRRRALGWVLVAVACMVTAVPLSAQRGGDDRRALAAREGGRILPLETLIRQIEAIVPGRLLEAELDEDDGITIYELRWQLADGRRLEIDVDARDGRWLKLKGPRLETVFRRSAAPATGGAR